MISGKLFKRKSEIAITEEKECLELQGIEAFTLYTTPFFEVKAR